MRRVLLRDSAEPMRLMRRAARELRERRHTERSAAIMLTARAAMIYAPSALDAMMRLLRRHAPLKSVCCFARYALLTPREDALPQRRALPPAASSACRHAPRARAAPRRHARRDFRFCCRAMRCVAAQAAAIRQQRDAQPPCRRLAIAPPADDFLRRHAPFTLMPRLAVAAIDAATRSARYRCRGFHYCYEAASAASRRFLAPPRHAPPPRHRRFARLFDVIVTRLRCAAMPCAPPICRHGGAWAERYAPPPPPPRASIAYAAP